MYKQTQKKEKRKMTSVLSFFLLCTNKHKTRKNEKWLPFYRFSFYVPTNTKKGKAKNDFRFIVFPFMYKQTQKKEKRKMTSVLSFFLLCTNKHKKRKNKKWLPFYRFSFHVRENKKTETQKSTSVLSFLFFVRTNTKNGKTTNDFLFIVFPFMYWNKQKHTNGNWLPFYRFSL